MGALNDPPPPLVTILENGKLEKVTFYFLDDKSEKKGPSAAVVAGIIVAVLFVLAIILVVLWCVRHRNKYHGGKSISYYKDMTTKPLEEDFDDDEATKIFDDRGSREKVEFA